MGIGTSLGAFYDDEFHYQQSQYDPSRFETNDQNVISPNKFQTDKALDDAELNPTTGMGLEIKDRMPFPNNNNPDTDFKNRFPQDMKPSGILNDLKPVINPGGPAMVRKISDVTSDYDYDAWRQSNPDVKMEPGQHYPDTYKYPNHMTFSDESIYHGKDGNEGGHWGLEDGKDTFTPGKTNLEQHSVEELKDYFKRVEPDVKLILK